MEFLGRVVVETANSHKLPYELEHSIAKYKIVYENTCVGLSRNNFLIEFSTSKNTNCDIKKGIKLEWKCQDLDIVYENGDKYLAVLTMQDKEGFAVFEAFDQSFKLIHQCPERFMNLRPIDTNGRQILFVQFSPTRSETFDSLCSPGEIKQLSSQESSSIELSDQESSENTQVSKILLVQKENAEKAISNVKKDVEELDNLIQLAISDLSCNNSEFSISETDVLNGLFHGNVGSREEETSKSYMNIEEIKSCQMENQKTLLWIKVSNDSNCLVDDLQLVMMTDGQVQVLTKNLDAMIKEDATKSVISETLGVSGTVDDKVTLQKLKAFQSVVFVAAVKDKFQGQLQFKIGDRLLTQKLVDEITGESSVCNRLELKEEILARTHLSLVQKCIRVESMLERHFDLHSALTKSTTLKNVCFRVYANAEVIIIVTKISEYSYELKFYTDQVKMLEEQLALLDTKLGVDVVYQLVPQDGPAVRRKSRHELLMDEIVAIESGRMPNEVITDRAFLFDH